MSRPETTARLTYPRLPAARHGAPRALAWAVLVCCLPSCAASLDGDELAELPVQFLEEELRIGSLNDPEAGFSRISAVAVDPQGRIFIAESQERQIRVHDSAGRRITAMGGPGAGPGEFNGFSSFGVVGDTVWVVDTGNRRITLFHADGSLLGMVRFEVEQHRGEHGTYGVVVFPGELQPDGSYTSVISYTITTRSTVPLAETGSPADTVRYPRLRYGPDGELLETLGWHALRFPEREPNPPLRLGDVAGTVSRRAYPESFLSLPARGGHVVEIEAAAAASPDAARFGVTLVGAAGDTLWSRSFGYQPIAVQPAQADSVYAAAGRQFRQRGVDSAAAERAIRAHLEIPAYLPPVTGVHLAATGEVWLRREDERADQRRWTVLDRSGRPLAHVLAPQSVAFHVIEGQRVWAVETDQFGVPWVVRYRITPGDQIGGPS